MPSTVSIHALLAECDPKKILLAKSRRCFNPRTPCGVRLIWNPAQMRPPMFQSTHSLRSATDQRTAYDNALKVSIHALLAECDPKKILLAKSRRCFNPRTPCGVRLIWNPAQMRPPMFQSTHSLRSATDQRTAYDNALKVSIHALLAECDPVSRTIRETRRGFNPRTPCGVRHIPQSSAALPHQFQSTHSLRSATTYFKYDQPRLQVSIHALLAECDILHTRIHGQTTRFNPRTPCGVRPLDRVLPLGRPQFQSTHSLRSATMSIPASMQDVAFQSTHSLRSATRVVALGIHRRLVSIHALLAECDCA